jgi:hypothetical protein
MKWKETGEERGEKTGGRKTGIGGERMQGGYRGMEEAKRWAKNPALGSKGAIQYVGRTRLVTTRKMPLHQDDVY